MVEPHAMGLASSLGGHSAPPGSSTPPESSVPPGSSVPPTPSGQSTDSNVVTFVSWWQDTCRASEDGARPTWPDYESNELVAAVLAAVTSSTDDGARRGLEAAARAFARATASTPVLVARLAALRQVLGPRCAPALQPRLASVLDTVVMLCTQAALTELEGAALTDVLTGAGNRRALETAARAALASASRNGHPLSMAVIDLDGLKVLNDTQGHGAGDRALAGLASALRHCLRETDQLFRIGGDEFVVLLPMAPAETVGMLLSRAVPAAPRFTWGSATSPNDGTGLEELLAVADARLYAKRRDAGYRRGVVPLASAGAAQTPGRPVVVKPRRHLLRAALVATASVLAVLGLVLLTGLATGGAHRTGNPGSGSVPPSTHGGASGSTTPPSGPRSGGPGSSHAPPPAGTTPPGGSTSGAPSGSGGPGPGPGGGPGPSPTTTSPIPTTTVPAVPTTTVPTLPIISVPVTVPVVTVPTVKLPGLG